MDNGDKIIDAIIECLDKRLHSRWKIKEISHSDEGSIAYLFSESESQPSKQIHIIPNFCSEGTIDRYEIFEHIMNYNVDSVIEKNMLAVLDSTKHSNEFKEYRKLLGKKISELRDDRIHDWIVEMTGSVPF